MPAHAAPDTDSPGEDLPGEDLPGEDLPALKRFPDEAFAGDLIEWFRAHRRDLPWRTDYDPYAVWVSEIMLQQTQVATVVPYFERFMARFPTMRDLAEAPEEEVMRLWAGLGYYSRARNLQTGVREVVERYGGRVPSTADELMDLQGIGRYTAGAIASIAYNESVPIVDGNVMRVLCRVFALPGDPKRGALNRRMWEIAGRLVPEGNAREFNPALMELGATVCARRSPRCAICPVSRHCEAFRRGEQERYPEPSPQPEPERVRAVCGVMVGADGRVLLVQPPSDGRWKGLWQLPNAALASDEDPLARLAGLAGDLGLQAGKAVPITAIRHGIGRYTISLEAFECAVDGGAYGAFPFRWADRDGLLETPLPAPHRKVARSWIRGTTPDLPPGRQLTLDL